jgi:5-methylcytosine-specific restriction protein A
MPIAEKGSKELAKPKWARDELILALDLYFRDKSAVGDPDHSAVLELSKVLNQLPIHQKDSLDADFRNPNGVSMKLSNFIRFDPSYSGAGLERGGQLEKTIWVEFTGDQDRLHSTANAIRENLGSITNQEEKYEDEDSTAEEGQILTRVHKTRERNQKLVLNKKDDVLTRTGKLACEACGFDFGVRYGSRGQGFAECHHLLPLCDLKPGIKTRIADLAILCANCHRMIHRKKPWLSLGDLKAILSTNST